jgi:choline dehydrogenase-like flavoprotein
MSGRIHTAEDVQADVDRSCDVVIVGSGAGGSILAQMLCEQGKDVVLLEEGGYHTRRDFDLTEPRAYRDLYQDFANRATDDQAITLLQGRCVGGGTTVNWTSSFRTPRRILDLWRDVHGVEGLTEETLGPHWDALEEQLHVAPWPLERVNRNNQILWDALGKLGYSRGLIPRNVHNCANTGYCGVGCPIDAKQSAPVAILPRAVKQGLTLYADARAQRILVQGPRATSVVAEVMNRSTRRPSGRRLTVHAKAVVVSCGAVNSPALLLRSELDGHGRVGQRTFLHPVVATAARFDEPVEGFYGAPQSVYSKHFVDRGPDKIGFFLEVPPIHPMLASTLGGFGKPLRDQLAHLPYLQAMLAITVDGVLPGDEGGRVGLRDGGRRLKIEYPLRAPNWEAFRTGITEMARLQLAAGASVVHSPHHVPVEMRSEKDLAKLEQAPWERLRLKVVTAHQMGGCAMGKDPRRSVVGSTFRYHGLDNLFVVDGSVLPTSLGVNPQLTIYGLGRLASRFVAAAV